MPRRKDPDAPAKKRGNPGDFKGEHLKFLTEHLEAYGVASKEKGKNKKLKDFWRSLFFAYWRKFPWRLAIDTDPPPQSEEEPAEEEPADAEAAFKLLDLDLSPEDQEMKSKIQKDTKEKIKRWYIRQRPKAVGMHGNPYFEHLKRMRRGDDKKPAPRKPTDYQFYMHHPDHKEKVADRFASEHGQDLPRDQQLSLRCRLAGELLQDEPEEVRDKLKVEREEMHKFALAGWKEAEEGMPSVVPEVQAEVRENFLATITPLLEGLRAYTGYTINIVAARVNEEGNFDVRSANAGDIKGKDWAQWDPEGYGVMLPRFLKFVHAQHQFETGVPSTSGPNASTSGAAASTSAAVASTSAAVAPAPANLLGANLITMTPEPEMPPPPASSRTEDVVMGRPLSDLPPLEDDDDDIMSGSVAFIPAPSDTPYVPPAPPAPSIVPSIAPSIAPSIIAPSIPRSTITPKEPAAPAEEDDETWGLSNVTTYLRAEIRARSEKERDQYLRSLRRMGVLELQRENNIARNRHWQKELGLMSASAFVGMKSKRPADDEGKRKKKRAKKNEEEEWDSEEDSAESSGSESGSGSDDDDDDDEDEEEEGTDAQKKSRKKPPPRTRAATARGAAPKDAGANKWAVVAQKNLLEGADRMGDGWTVLVGLWWDLEKSTGFVTKPKGLPTTNRPKQISHWVQRARQGTPELMVNSFSRDWWAWWKVLNPKWRLRDGLLVREGTGSWDALRNPGQNGLLNVVVCLKWWHERLETEAQREDWSHALEDVTWVLRGMLGYTPDGSAVTAANPAPPAANPAPPAANPAAPPAANPAAPPADADPDVPAGKSSDGPTASTAPELPPPAANPAAPAKPGAPAENRTTPAAPARVSPLRRVGKSAIRSAGIAALIAADDLEISTANGAPESPGTATGAGAPHGEGPKEVNALHPVLVQVSKAPATEGGGGAGEMAG